jgi:hypothetical protein
MAKGGMGRLGYPPEFKREAVGPVSQFGEVIAGEGGAPRRRPRTRRRRPRGGCWSPAARTDRLRDRRDTLTYSHGYFSYRGVVRLRVDRGPNHVSPYGAGG